MSDEQNGSIALTSAIGRGLLIVVLGFGAWQMQQFASKVDSVVVQLAVLQSRFEGELAVRLWADKETAAKIGRLEIRAFGYVPGDDIPDKNPLKTR